MMQNLTKIRIMKPCHEVFDAFVNPTKIGGYWFSSSSTRWEKDRTVTLKYDEYHAQVDIKIIEIEENRKIVFQWGANENGNIVTILLRSSNDTSTIVEVNEDGFDEHDADVINLLLGNKEGWVYTLTCLKAYLEFGIHELRAALVKE